MIVLQLHFFPTVLMAIAHNAGIISQPRTITENLMEPFRVAIPALIALILTLMHSMRLCRSVKSNIHICLRMNFAIKVCTIVETVHSMAEIALQYYLLGIHLHIL